MQVKDSPLNAENAPAYWQVDILWLMLATGSTTDGQYALIEELCPKNSGPPPHTHTQLETFYILEGQVTFLVGSEMVTAQAGSFLSVPPGVTHSFRVDSDSARLLNSYVPAGFEQTVITLGEPALTRTLPPPGRPMNVDPATLAQVFEKAGMRPVQEPDRLRVTADPRMHLQAMEKEQ